MDCIAGVLGAAEEIENSRKMIDFFVNISICVSNIFFGHKSICRYKRIGVGKDGIEVEIIIEFF